MRAIIIVMLVASTAVAEPEPKDEGTATLVSASGTAVSGLLLGIGFTLGDEHGGVALGVTGAAGLLIAPSFGHWYAHEPWSAGMIMRVGGIVGGVALVAALPCSRSDNPMYECGSSPGAKLYGAAAGAAVFALGVGWDIATAGGAARRYNREHDLAIVPIAGGYGLSVAGRW